MKTKSKWKHIVIMFLFLFFFALCISFHLTIYGVESAQVIEGAHLASINSEYINSGDGNNYSPNHNLFSNLKDIPD